MIDSDDIEFFRQRASEEQALSQSAANPAAALIHSNLAKRYERLAAKATTKRPTLHIASGPRPGASTGAES